MNIMKRAGAVAAGAAIAVTGLVALAGPASAGYDDCSSGNACMWTGYSYPGSPNASFSWSIVLTSSSNEVSSIVNNGNSSIARYYDSGNHTGTYIALNNPARGGQWRDPDLSNGINATGADWDDRISSAKFV